MMNDQARNFALGEQLKPHSNAISALDTLETGPLFWFADWPTGNVPRLGAIVYTVWDRSNCFIYTGMAGRSGTSTNGSGPHGDWRAMQADDAVETNFAFMFATGSSFPEC
jgi:hypothetical protein